MNKKLLLSSVVLNIIFLMVYFTLEYHRTSISGVYYGQKCWYSKYDKEYESHILSILELNYDGTFEFSSDKRTDVLYGKWKEESDRLIFITNRHIDEAKFSKGYKIYFEFFSTDNNRSRNNLIEKVHRCHLYSRLDNDWWSSWLGLVYLTLFTISFLVTLVLFSQWLHKNIILRKS